MKNAHTPGNGVASATRDRNAFNLIRWFSLLTLAAIVVVGIVTSLLLSAFLTKHMLQRDATLTMEEVQSIVHVGKAGDYFRNGVHNSGDPHAQEFFQFIASMHDVLRTNFYAKDGTVIWSTDQSLVGKAPGRNPELDESLSGRLTVESGTVGEEVDPKPEHVNLGRRGESFVENYIPIRDPETAEIIGVAELYRVPTALFDTIRTGNRLIWLSSIGGGIFLYIVLIGIVKRADRTMRTQQTQLVQAETLSAVGQLAGVVAHGLRNPLASIRSSAELALEAPADDVKETSQDIIAEVDRLERMVRQLLYYSQAPSVDLEDIHVERLLRDTASHFTRDFERRNVIICLEIPPDLPPVVADAALLEHVLNSLLANALDAMGRGGRLTLSAARNENTRAVDVAIADTGKGIPAAQMASLFTPFRTTKTTGLGIGLALAERIVRRFGGTLRIESVEGQGTTVHLQLRSNR
jgi:two-component system sensor histidine kinase HydH